MLGAVVKWQKINEKTKIARVCSPARETKKMTTVLSVVTAVVPNTLAYFTEAKLKTCSLQTIVSRQKFRERLNFKASLLTALRSAAQAINILRL
jgi:hypothetical protein